MPWKESSVNIPFSFFLMDWSATYRSDSTIAVPYGRWKHYDEKDREIMDNPKLFDISGKSKMIGKSSVHSPIQKCSSSLGPNF